MAANTKHDQQGLLQLVEESTGLLRSLPISAWAWYFSGTLLFICSLLHFWNDMSRGAGADYRLAASSLLLALCYVFMKVAHALFGDYLLRQLKGDQSPAPLPFRSKIRLFTSQTLIHSLMPWVLPLSLAAMLPFGWSYAAFHNTSILSLQILREGGRTRDIIRTATVQSHYRQGQNHGLMIILLFFSIAIWMNLFFGLMLIAVLGSSFTGSTNAIALNPWILLSTSVLAATICGSYVICAPLVKAAYALRCFHSLSRKTGEDLMVSFRNAASKSLVLATVSLLLISPVNAQSTIPPDKLEQSIETVLQQDAFQWRMPRESAANDKGGWLSDFMDAVALAIRDGMKSLGKWIDAAMGSWLENWFKERFHPGMDDSEDSSSTRASTIQTILWVILGILGVALLIVLYRQWRKLPPAPAKTGSSVPDINLESETVVASQLPEQEWLKLAQEKAAGGDYRLAMRALFLATLAHLGERKLIAISRWKSNGDYKRELRFRHRGGQIVQSAFEQSVSMFDRTWYGWHDVTSELLDNFTANHQAIITHAQAS